MALVPLRRLRPAHMTHCKSCEEPRHMHGFALPQKRPSFYLSMAPYGEREFLQRYSIEEAAQTKAKERVPSRRRLSALRGVIRIFRQKTDKRAAAKRQEPANLLTLPWELKLEILKYLSGPCPFYARPQEHHVYVFLFVSKAWRNLASDLFYTNTHFRFACPRLCNSFFTFTRNHLPSLTSLNVTAKTTETASLEPIFLKLHEAHAPLRTLVIHLKRATHDSRPYPYNLEPEPRPGETLGMPGWYWALPENAGEAMKRTSDCTAALGMLEGLRYLAICGQPVRAEAFEWAIVKLHFKMQQMAVREGRKVLGGKYGTSWWARREWWFDAYIEGEDHPVGY